MQSLQKRILVKLTFLLPALLIGVGKKKAEGLLVRLAKTFGLELNIQIERFRLTNIHINYLECKAERYPLFIEGHRMVLQFSILSILKSGRLMPSCLQIQLLVIKTCRTGSHNSRKWDSGAKIEPYHLAQLTKLFSQAYRYFTDPGKIKISVKKIKISIRKSNTSVPVNIKDISVQKDRVCGLITFPVYNEILSLKIDVLADTVDKVLVLECTAIKILRQDRVFFDDQPGETNPLIRIWQENGVIKTESFCNTKELPRLVNNIWPDVQMHSLQWSLKTESANGYFRIQETSVLTVNAVPFNFYAEILMGERTTIEAGITLSDIPLEQIFKSIPFLQRRSYFQMSCRGNMSLNFQVLFDINNPSEMDMDFTLYDKDTAVKFDDGNGLLKLREPYVYSFISSELIELGPAVKHNNLYFFTLPEIPSYVKDIIVRTEDPAFFTHKGIDRMLLKQSLITNITEKKIVKGAGTITMQLVRNLFLNKSRSFIRKAEEMILAWLVERHLQISKERILELYLNMIEFAPSVYGIGEASLFYFDKTVQQLSFTEAFILSYVIPRPKTFFAELDRDISKLAYRVDTHIRIYCKVLFISHPEYADLDSTAHSNYGIVENLNKMKSIAGRRMSERSHH